MSRFTMKEPLATAHRHASTGSPQRNMKPSFHSNVLAAFDEEFARLQQAENIGSSTSNMTTRMSLKTSTIFNANNGTSLLPVKSKSTTQTVKKAQSKEWPNLPLYSYKLSNPTPVRVYIRDETEADEQVSKLQGCEYGHPLLWPIY